MARFAFLGIAAVPTIAALGLLVRAGDEPAKPSGAVDAAFFDKQVLPILRQHCFKCHGDGKVRGGLRLISRENVLKGGDSGPAVVLEKPETSRLLQAINYKDGLEMPPDGKLPQKKIDVLTRWVKAGAPWTPGAKTAETAKSKAGEVTVDARNYWAYRPVRRPDVPKVEDVKWVRNPIDAFLLAKLEPAGLKPASPAEFVALVRRADRKSTRLNSSH